MIDLSTPERKRTFNEHHFTLSAPRYDLVTRILSFGQDAGWKRQLIDALPLKNPHRVLDLACGTGDITLALAEKFPESQIEGLDITQAMLDIANGRNRFKNVSFVKKDMCPLDYLDQSLDLVTGGYALRNAPVLKEALKEIHRVLIPGGIGAFLDFSKPEGRLSQTWEAGILKFWGSLWGLLLHGDPKVHGYISESLKTYPSRSRLQHHLIECGFEIISQKQFFLGITDLIVVKKNYSIVESS